MCLPTMTHARLRADQGDLVGARRILRDILEGDPRNDEARALLARLGSRRGRQAADDRPAPAGLPAAAMADAGLPAVASAKAGDLADAFRRELSTDEPSPAPDAGDAAHTATTARRVERLERWLARIRSGSTAGH
jgi:hypothetical protein